MYRQNVESKKNLRRKFFFIDILKATDKKTKEPDPEPDPIPDP